MKKLTRDERIGYVAVGLLFLACLAAVVLTPFPVQP